DMFELGGKYYIIATCHNGESVEIFHNNKMRVKPQFRGCFALVSDRPDGGYKLVSKEPLTPRGQMCLDGTLWEENGKLYLIYCREWVQVWDGEVVACEVARDLSKLVGEPKVLFTASAAKWNNISRSGGKSCGVTDAPVVNRAEDGTLFMTWSSGGTCADGQSRYVVACAVSDNGSIFGDWIQDEIPLNCDDGGHAMLFKTFGGKTKIAYHAPNKKPFCHTVIADFSFKNGKASIAPEKD
ncbi:MAG: family 43 glycosylhydrolase, partial [Opitutales bacterium]|nr:family 43 glycosylhydrolase [Opitutales bacterium]